jgi:hypothetical protein
MVDILVKPTPLPVSRPSGIDGDYQPFIAPGMPFKSTEKAVDAFSEGGWYTPTSPSVKPLSELLMALGSLSVILALAGVVYWKRKEIWTYVSGIYSKWRN